MDDHLREETRIALEMIETLIKRTSRLVDLANSDKELPESESIHRDEFLALDKLLSKLATRLWKGPIPQDVWEPPGGAAFIKSAGSRNRSAGLSSYLAALHASRAFFSSFLTTVSSNSTSASISVTGEQPATLVDKWKSSLQNNRFIALTIFVGTLVIALGTFTDALKSLQGFFSSTSLHTAPSHETLKTAYRFGKAAAWVSFIRSSIENMPQPPPDITRASGNAETELAVYGKDLHLDVDYSNLDLIGLLKDPIASPGVMLLDDQIRMKYGERIADTFITGVTIKGLINNTYRKYFHVSAALTSDDGFDALENANRQAKSFGAQEVPPNTIDGSNDDALNESLRIALERLDGRIEAKFN